MLSVHNGNTSPDKNIILVNNISHEHLNDFVHD